VPRPGAPYSGDSENPEPRGPGAQRKGATMDLSFTLATIDRMQGDRLARQLVRARLDGGGTRGQLRAPGPRGAGRRLARALATVALGAALLTTPAGTKAAGDGPAYDIGVLGGASAGEDVLDAGIVCGQAYHGVIICDVRGDRPVGLAWGDAPAPPAPADREALRLIEQNQLPTAVDSGAADPFAYREDRRVGQALPAADRETIRLIEQNQLPELTAPVPVPTLACECWA
jgi:hypothetical protein